MLGAGGEFEKLNFHFSDYHFYTFIGGGFHLFFTSMFSLRFDLRFLHFSDLTAPASAAGFSSTCSRPNPSRGARG